MGKFIPLGGNRKMDESILSAVGSVGEAYGIPLDILYSIMMTESGGNPSAHTVTSQEDSRGLFQVNIKAHPDANSGQLFDPTYNAKYIMPELATAYNQGKSQGLSGADLAVYVEKNGERPAWNSTVENNVRKYYSEYSGDSSSSSGSSGTSIIKTGFLSGASDTLSKILDFIKFYGIYVLLFVLLIFSLNIIFNSKED